MKVTGLAAGLSFCAGSASAAQSLGLGDLDIIGKAIWEEEQILGLHDTVDLVTRLEDAMKHFDEAHDQARRRIDAEVFSYNDEYSYSYSFSFSYDMPTARPTYAPGDPTPAPSTARPTYAPGDPTPAPSTEQPTYAPGDPTPAPTTARPTYAPGDPTPKPTPMPTPTPTRPGVSGFVTFKGSFLIDVDGTADELNADEDFLFAMQTVVRNAANYNSTYNFTRDEIQDIGTTAARRRALKAAMVIEYTIVTFYELSPLSSLNAETFAASFQKKVSKSIVQHIRVGLFQTSISNALTKAGSSLTVDLDEDGSVDLTEDAEVTFTISSGKKKKKDDDDVLILVIILVICIPVGLILLALVAMAFVKKSASVGVTTIAATPAGNNKVAPEAAY